MLTPKDAKKYFEFFKKGTQREVILLGDLLEQHVHYVRWKNHKVLCGARLGPCDLCARAGTSDDVSDRHVEYYAAAVVKGPSDRRFSQRVAVFTAVSGEELLRLVPEGSLRGHRFEIRRLSTQQVKIRPLAGPPRGLAHVVPPEFDLLPFVRGRFGLPQEPDRPAVFLAPFECKDLVSGPAHRPRALDLSADDVKPSAEILARFHNYVAGLKPTEQPEQKPAEAAVLATAQNPAAYGPKQAVEPSMTPSAEKVAEAQRRRVVPSKEATEAVEAGQVVGFILGRVNGNGKKGGAS